MGEHIKKSCQNADYDCGELSYYRLVEERAADLRFIIQRMERRLKTAPPGKLYVRTGHGYPQYYFVDEETKDERYLPKSKKMIIRSLVKKDYEQRVLKAATVELKMLDSLLRIVPDQTVESVYRKLPDARQCLVTPVRKSDREYLEEWKNTPYTSKNISDDTPKFFTNRKEQVRSKSEVLIANLLDNLGIPYRYEARLVLPDNTVIHPDFTLPDVLNREDIYFEHFGMADDPVYAERMIQRLELYEANGIFPGSRLLLSFEGRRQPLEITALENMLRKRFLYR